MQIVLNGIISGLAIALLALAFQVVYLPTRVFFIGLAGLYAVAPYLFLSFRNAGLALSLSIVGTLTTLVALALVFEWLNHGRLTRKRASSGAHLIASLGTYIVMVQVIVMIWGNDSKIIRVGLDFGTRHGGILITGTQWITAGVAIAMICGLFSVLRHSGLGLKLRALADNPTQFALSGNNLTWYRLFAFGCAGLFAGCSSLLTAYDIGFSPFLGLHSVLLAVVAVIIGGQSTFFGPVLGALLLGVVRSQIVWHWSARWQEGATFMVLALFLLLRPSGLIGHKKRLDTAT